MGEKLVLVNSFSKISYFTCTSFKESNKNVMVIGWGFFFVVVNKISIDHMCGRNGKSSL